MAYTISGPGDVAVISNNPPDSASSTSPSRFFHRAAWVRERFHPERQPRQNRRFRSAEIQ
jgi:hypothetical protein